MIILISEIDLCKKTKQSDASSVMKPSSFSIWLFVININKDIVTIVLNNAP